MYCLQIVPGVDKDPVRINIEYIVCPDGDTYGCSRLIGYHYIRGDLGAEYLVCAKPDVIEICTGGLIHQPRINIVEELHLAKPDTSHQEIPFTERVSKCKIDLILWLACFDPAPLLTVEQRKRQIIGRIGRRAGSAWVILRVVDDRV